MAVRPQIYDIAGCAAVDDTERDPDHLAVFCHQIPALTSEGVVHVPGLGYGFPNKLIRCHTLLCRLIDRVEVLV